MGFREYLTATCLVAVTLGATSAGASPAQSTTTVNRSVLEMPEVPSIVGAVAGRVRAIYSYGATKGNTPRIFAKAGDSITATDSFMVGFACGEEHLADRRHLADSIASFRSATLPPDWSSSWCGHSDSFSRSSLAAASGWTAETILGPGPDTPRSCRPGHASPLACEIHLLKPFAVFIMVGTNDLERSGRAGAFARQLGRIAKYAARNGVIPVLSTIPPRLDSASLNARADLINASVARVARRDNLPLINLWRALQAPGMVNRGVDEDGVHLNLFGMCRGELGCRAFDFTEAGLRYGYNQRNLLVMETLHALRTFIGASND